MCCAVFVLCDTVLSRESHQRKQILHMKRRFVRFISHEIRTPLNAIIGFSEVMKEEVLGPLAPMQPEPGVLVRARAPLRLKTQFISPDGFRQTSACA